MEITDSSFESNTYKAALAKLSHFCAYQERCHQEVRYKLIQLKVYGDDLEQIISRLVQIDFLNEERFARSFARGRIRLKKWSRTKVIVELNKRDISDYVITMALTEIDDAEYFSNIDKLIEKKISTIPEELNAGAKKRKVSIFMNSKGYTYDEYKISLDVLIQK